MITSHFESILEDLGKIIKIKGLKLDAVNTCQVHFPNGLNINIEPTKKDEMLISCNLGEVPLGRYRENLFREALKANGLPYPRHGTLSYSDQSNHLILFRIFPLKELNGEKVANYLKPFMEKALIWKAALERSEIPVVDTGATGVKSSPLGLFGGLR